MLQAIKYCSMCSHACSQGVGGAARSAARAIFKAFSRPIPPFLCGFPVDGAFAGELGDGEIAFLNFPSDAMRGGGEWV